jgi:hypothetical protein
MYMALEACLNIYIYIYIKKKKNGGIGDLEARLKVPFRLYPSGMELPPLLVSIFIV